MDVPPRSQYLSHALHLHFLLKNVATGHNVMSESLARSIARIHADRGIYKAESFNARGSQNILHHLAEFKELPYLYRFYSAYRKEYLKQLNSRSEQRPVRPLIGVARSVDLPYVGEGVVDTVRAKYIFVFEGALSKEDHLSVTVLACLWPLISNHPIHKMFSLFWPSTFDNIVDSLGINPEVAKHSYVVDAVRIGTTEGRQDRDKNRELLRSEIKLLKPELVVMVGKTAECTVGNETQREAGPKYSHVPFPTKWRSRAQVALDAQKYIKLQKLIARSRRRGIQILV
jgi:hypothetical protein